MITKTQWDLALEQARIEALRVAYRRSLLLAWLRLATMVIVCLAVLVTAFILSGCKRDYDDAIVNARAADSSAGIPHPGHYIPYPDTTGIDTLTPPAGGTQAQVDSTRFHN